jgi:hypothetical protein
MTQTLLLSFGDSWPYGAELLPGSKTYGQLLAEYNNAEYKCYAIPATSNYHLLLQLKLALSQERLSDKKIVALFTFTSPTRSIYFDQTEFKEIHVRNDDVTSKTYFKYLHSEQLDYLNSNIIMLALQQMCYQHHIIDYYVSGFCDINFDFPGINRDKIFNKSLVDLLDCRQKFNTPNKDFFQINKLSPFIFPNVDNHPNQAGHVEISHALHKWINSIID